MRRAPKDLCGHFGAGRTIRGAIFSLTAAVAFLGPAGLPEAKAVFPASSPTHALSSGAGHEIPASRFHLAKKVERDDYILYKTDFADPKTPQQLEQEEKEKEERAWQMLDRTEIYQFRGKPPRQPKEDRRP